jgi:hypothetical protein
MTPVLPQCHCRGLIQSLHQSPLLNVVLLDDLEKVDK